MGNIITGLELIRRLGGAAATAASSSGNGASSSNGAAGEEGNAADKAEPCFGLTFPLLTKADGTKMGKSASGAVWLAAGRDSFYPQAAWASLGTLHNNPSSRSLSDLWDDPNTSPDCQVPCELRHELSSMDSWHVCSCWQIGRQKAS
jgi:hypothetical protein